jgi:hypothetical protein
MQRKPSDGTPRVEILLRATVLVVSLGLSLPGAAAAQDQAQLLADVLLEEPETYEGGSLFGPPESRGTWYSFGGIEPIGGNAMLAFSTGDADGPPQPGVDLGVLNGADDRAGMNLSLRVPEGAHSMRLSYRFITPALPDEDSSGDEARMLLAGELVALDPWTLSVGSVSSAGLTDDELALEDTWYAPPAGQTTPWTEVAVPVSPGDQLLVTLEVEDDPASDLGDVLLLVDRLSFDAGRPEFGGIRPGRVPLIHSVNPARIPPGAASHVVLSGRDLPGPGGLSLSLESGSGETLEIPLEEVDWLSSERLALSLPGLAAGDWGVRLSWDGGVLLWSGLLEVAPKVPRIQSLTPDTGPPVGGGLVLVEGVGFDDVSSLRWAGEVVTSYTVHSGQQIELVVPPAAPGTVDLSIFAAGGWDEAPDAYRYAQDSVSDSPGPNGTTGTPPQSCTLSGGLRATAEGLLLLGLGLLITLRKRRT